MEEETDPFMEPPEQNDELIHDFVEVPEDVKVPDSSSSPEMIGLEGEQEEEEKVQDEDSETLGNLEREPDDIPSPPTPEPEIPPTTSSYVGAIEDIGPHVVPLPVPEGSPKRPGTKTVEMPRATGYFSHLNALHPVVLYLIYWCDAKLSALSLTLSLVVLLTLYVNTFLHTVTLLLLAAMVVSLVYIVTKIAIDSFYNRPIINPFHKYLEQDMSFPEEDIVNFIRKITRKMNCYLKVLVRVVFFANTFGSLKFMIVLFLASYVTNCFDILTVLFLVLGALYIFPFVYSKYQSTIDAHINTLLFKVNNVYSRIVEKVPFLPKPKSD